MKLEEIKTKRALFWGAYNFEKEFDWLISEVEHLQSQVVDMQRKIEKYRIAMRSWLTDTQDSCTCGFFDESESLQICGICAAKEALGESK